MKRAVVAYVGVVLFALAPILVAIGSGSVAHALGCQVDEGSVHPCVVAGMNWGPLFYDLGVLGWLFLVTLPLGGILFVALTIFLLVRKARQS